MFLHFAMKREMVLSGKTGIQTQGSFFSAISFGLVSELSVWNAIPLHWPNESSFEIFSICQYFTCKWRFSSSLEIPFDVYLFDTEIKVGRHPLQLVSNNWSFLQATCHTSWDIIFSTQVKAEKALSLRLEHLTKNDWITAGHFILTQS